MQITVFVCYLYRISQNKCLKFKKFTYLPIYLFSELNLPDSFNSWFLITELHLWMVFVRLMNEGTKGSMVRNFITEALWNDVEFRTKKLGPVRL